MRKYRLFWFSFIILCSLPGLTLAQKVKNIPTSPPIVALSAPHLTDTLLHGFTFSGYIDTSYNYLLKGYHFTDAAHNRFFDIEPNGFTLQQAAITLAKQPPQGLGGLLNLILGRDANSLTMYGMNPNYFGIQNMGLDVPQVYLQYAFSSFTLAAGKFSSLLGKESYDPTQDTHFSRSMLYQYIEPFTILGIRATYILKDRLQLIADINNGWDTIEYPSRQKTLEARMAYILNSLFNFSIAGITGIQPVTDGSSFGPTGRRSALNLIGTWHANRQLDLIASYDYGVQTKATLPTGQLAKALWQGMAGYLNYQINDKWKTSLRAEVLYDQNGARTGIRQSWREVTLTAAYSLYKNLQIRGETRRDFSNVSAFANKNGLGSSHYQQSFTLEGLYLF